MKCIVHIGTEKTGSTAIQRALGSNRDFLREAGVAVLWRDDETNSRTLAAWFRERPDDYWRANHWTTAEQKKHALLPSMASFINTVNEASQTAEVGVVSSEHFHSRVREGHEIEALAEFLFSRFDEVEIVCFVRPQDELRASLHSTMVRAGSRKKYERFNLYSSIDLDYFDYRRVLTRWIGVFGRDRIRVFPYSPSLEPGSDIRRDFFEQLLPGIELNSLQLGPVGDNRALSRRQIEAMRLLNTVVRRPIRQFLQDTGALDRIRKMLLQQRFLQSGGTIFYGDPVIRDYFASSNQWVSDEFGIDPRLWS